MPDEPKNEDPESRYKASVDELVNAIKGAPDAIREAAKSAVQPHTPEPPQSQLTEERLNEIAQEHGVGAAMKVLAQEGMVPMQMHNYGLIAKQAKKLVERDPDLGDWAKQHRAEIDAKVKADGISAQYLAEHGYEDIVRSMRDQDPAVRQAMIEAEVQRRLAEVGGDVHPPIPKTPPPIGRPGPAPRSAPVLTPQQTRDQAIASIEMSQADIDFQKRFFKLTPEEAKRQRYEREELERKHGEHGLKAMGGYPICTLADLGIPEAD